MIVLSDTDINKLHLLWFLQNVEEEVQANVASLDNAKGLADKIKELSSEDPVINKDLDDHIQKVEAPLNELISTLNARQSELQIALLQSQELKDSVEEFSGWLSAAENRLNLQGHVSARHKVITDQQDKLQVCDSNVWGVPTRDEKHACPVILAAHESKRSSEYYKPTKFPL